MAYIDVPSRPPYSRPPFHERHPTLALWAIGAVQAVAMLGIYLVLRALAA